MIGTLPVLITKEQIEIIKAVLYFDVFSYPLTLDELYENSAVKISRELFLKELNGLFETGLLKKKNEFVLSVCTSEGEILRRQNGNKGAKAIMPTAYEYSSKIASFPFVEAVFLSGALAKNYYDEKGDIDFFIVTKPGRLWVCRTLLIIRYKLLPEKKKKYWCTNYFVSSDQLELPDINAFTGTELAYLIPTVNYPVYQKMIGANRWYKTQFPNKPEAPDLNCMEMPKSFFRSLVEKILGNGLGGWLDDKLLSITLRHWQKKYPELALEDFELQFRSRKNVCKRHTRGFQNKVLKTWDEKQKEYEKLFKIALR
jgi:hypothetical protein